MSIVRFALLEVLRRIRRSAGGAGKARELGGSTMPVYRLKCRKCGKESRRTLKIAERNEQTCDAPGCEGSLDTQIVKGSFVLKGQGWYKDGYQ